VFGNSGSGITAVSFTDEIERVEPQQLRLPEQTTAGAMNAAPEVLLVGGCERALEECTEGNVAERQSEKLRSRAGQPLV
jgi:hypothetical protein